MSRLRALLLLFVVTIFALPSAGAQCEPSCLGGLIAFSVEDSAHGPIAVSGLGNADGEIAAVSLARNAEAGTFAVSVMASSPGNSAADVSVAGAGNANGELVAVSGTGNSRALIAVSGTGHAEGTIAVGGGDL